MLQGYCNSKNLKKIEILRTFNYSFHFYNVFTTNKSFNWNSNVNLLDWKHKFGQNKNVNTLSNFHITLRFSIILVLNKLFMDT